MSATTALEVTGLSAGYGDITAVRDIDLRIGEGEVLAVLGRNGAGKTTTLHAVAGLIPRRAGTVRLRGVDISELPAHRRAAMGMALVQQGKRIFHRRTVEENLLLGGYTMPRRSRAAAVERALEQFPMLATKRRLLSATLSGGQQQMLAIAQALMPGPSILLLDEPSGGLAPIIVDELLEVVRRLKADGLTILIVEQLVDQALAVADTVTVLDRGRVVASAPVAEVDRDALRDIYLGSGRVQAGAVRA